MSGRPVPIERNGEAWGRAALRWLFLILGVALAIGAACLALAALTGEISPERAGHWLVGTGAVVGVAGVLIHLRLGGYFAPYDLPGKYVLDTGPESSDGARRRSEVFEITMLAASTAILLCLAGYALGAGR